MLRNKRINKILLYLLVFSFILISLAYVPIYVRAGAQFPAASSDKASDSHTSVGISLQSLPDYPEAETLYKYHIIQNFETKRLGGESRSFLITKLLIPTLDRLPGSLSEQAAHAQCSMRMVLFQHDKDGMIQFPS